MLGNADITRTRYYPDGAIRYPIGLYKLFTIESVKMSVNPIDAVLKTYDLETKDDFPSRYILLHLKEDEHNNVLVDLITEGIRDEAEVVVRILENVAKSIRDESRMD